MKRLNAIIWMLIALVLCALMQPAVHACTACFGKSDSSMAQGMNMGIFVLLFVITSVLCGIAGFFVFLAKRSRELENSRLGETFSTDQSNA